MNNDDPEMANNEEAKMIENEEHETVEIVANGAGDNDEIDIPLRASMKLVS